MKLENSEKYIKIINLTEAVQNIEMQLREKSNTYEEKIKDMKIEVSDLQNKNKTLIEECDLLKLERNNHIKNQQSLNEIEKSLSMIKSENETLNRELIKYLSENEKLNKEISQTCKIKIELEDEIQHLKNDLKTKEELMKQNENNLLNNFEVLKTHHTELQSKYDLLDAKYVESEQYYVERIETFETIINDLKSQAINLNNDLETYKELNDDMNKENQNLKNKIISFEESNTEKDHHLQEVQKEKLFCSEEIVQLNKENQILLCQIDDLSSSLKEVETNFANLKNV